jgi:hypothetical protein
MDFYRPSRDLGSDKRKAKEKKEEKRKRKRKRSPQPLFRFLSAPGVLLHFLFRPWVLALRPL